MPDDKRHDDPAKTPRKNEKKNPQSEKADDTGLYDRDEDMYNQDAEVLEEEKDE